jgi:hypothetical protein
MVTAPLEVFWKFKTDFKNDFVLTNKLITKHRLVEQSTPEPQGLLQQH